MPHPLAKPSQAHFLCPLPQASQAHQGSCVCGSVCVTLQTKFVTVLTLHQIFFTDAPHAGRVGRRAAQEGHRLWLSPVLCLDEVLFSEREESHSPLSGLNTEKRMEGLTYK